MDLINMQLFTVRTVIVNDVNDITVCEDRARDTGSFYTVISIKAPDVRREVAHHIATEGLFSTNVDFKGSYTQGDRLNLVFDYRNENRLSVQQAVLCTNDKRRVALAENMLIATAETQVTPSVGLLLLSDRNINATNNLDIFFNYFLDFSAWNKSATQTDYYRELATRIFNILAEEYELKYSGTVNRYPSELQVLYRKARSGGFNSYSSMITFVKLLSDGYTVPATGWRLIWSKIKAMMAFIKRNWTTILAIVLVAVTIIFTVYQIYIRVQAQQLNEENLVYIGLEQIGDVFLGDEDL